MDDEEESVVRKLGNTDDSTKTSSEMASAENQSSNGVSYIEGDQGYPDSWGGMDEDIDNHDENIDNRGNNAVDYQHLNQSSSNTQNSSPRCTSPFQQAQLSPPRDPQSETHVPQVHLSGPTTTPVRSPFAPGGPSSPIENAFTRLAATSAHIPAAFSMVTNDNVIDPALLKMGNHVPTVSDYQLPCATVDQALVTTPEEMCLAEKKSTPKKGRRVTKAQGPKNSGTQKRGPARNKSLRGARAPTQMTENQPAQTPPRTRKRKRNPDGDEFTNPKKGKRT